MRCLADYYRMPVADTRAAVETLVEAGELSPVTVAGLDARRRTSTATPACRGASGARALLSPSTRSSGSATRAETLFDFSYRIEIYVPADKRVHGYYVLPFLLGDRIVARVDLKADRATGRLLVQGAYAEPGAPRRDAPRSWPPS